ncbi:FAD-binding oxidoreductase [Aeromicrobium sp. Root236]|uniref:FAD-binding oxidoreductase n=1 Tax=Aeromicrobium sp. Root236 TaxID=1736498 RepID=UPI0009E7E968|nr:FAD-binding oxidoreductase [Aeromicrobium sp. Root236]
MTELSAALDGEVLTSGDPGYDEARTVWNAMVDRRPRMIVRCRSVSDVVAAIAAARADGLEIGVRCGGHSVVGHAVPDDGMMIDLTPMGEVVVDAERRRARVQGGALLGALDIAAQQHGLATTAGNVSHTGVGGLTLGGGMGWLARQHGLSCDNVVSFELVTAAGEVLRASETENPELFWGLRGGGGNFGIVTEFEFRLHPVGTQALVVEHDFPADESGSALRAWRDLSATAPRPATFTAFVLNGLVTLGYVWVGDPAEGRALLSSFDSIGTPTETRVLDMSYVELQQRDDTVDGHEFRRYWKGHYFTELSDELIDVMLEGSRGPGLVPAASLQAYGGAIADVPDDATAFSQRGTAFEFVTAARWTDPAEDVERIAAARAFAGTLDAYASGAYVNALNDEGLVGVRRAYPAEKLARLIALKDTYDPDNVFRLNQNIPPSGA